MVNLAIPGLATSTTQQMGACLLALQKAILHVSMISHFAFAW
jgi:hypothetical protein